MISFSQDIDFIGGATSERQCVVTPEVQHAGPWTFTITYWIYSEDRKLVQCYMPDVVSDNKWCWKSHLSKMTSHLVSKL